MSFPRERVSSGRLRSGQINISEPAETMPAAIPGDVRSWQTFAMSWQAGQVAVAAATRVVTVSLLLLTLRLQKKLSLIWQRMK